MRETNHASDHDLVARIRGGEGAAFEALFRRYYAPLVGFTTRYVNSSAIAEELVQDVFTSVWERRTQLEVTASLQGYLYTAARNKALSHAAHGQVERRWTEDVLHKQPPGDAVDRSAPESEFYAGELGELVQSVVATMPERRRIIYQLSRDRHMTYHEIAAILDIAPKTRRDPDRPCTEDHPGCPCSRWLADLASRPSPPRFSAGRGKPPSSQT